MGEMELAVKQYQQYADYIRFTPVHDAQEGKGYDCSVLAKLFESATLARTLPHFKIIGAIDRFVNMANPCKTYRECYWQRLRPVVGADGFLYPCCVLNYYEKHRVLDLRAYPAFELAWNSAERKHKHSILNPHFCPPCWVDAENQMACYLADKEVPHVEFV
jgi:MoaA/NifB/PqqE/SkfB family radical SAM enzyme